jgi:ankyrin repeat protein
VNASDKYSCTVLHYATRAGLVEIVKQLVENKAEVNACDADGITILHCAARAGARLEVIE